ncbi:pollen-specific protein C13, partial [Oryza sativa Japonica Group]|uniref:pollen-specific protein C13 n=1 Tax=Oryza sativa subsp. japonica TaxID=39947 RepID=UPI00339CACE7
CVVMASGVVMVMVVVTATAMAMAVQGSRHSDFFVEGEVYCDTCRAGFVTNVTTAIQAARVRLECRHYMSASGSVERSAEGTTDATGHYRMELVEVDNRGAELVCAVALLSSPVTECHEMEVGRDRAPVTLVQDVGLATMVRRANPLGFLQTILQTRPLPICGDLLKSYALGTAPSY